MLLRVLNSEYFFHTSMFFILFLCVDVLKKDEKGAFNFEQTAVRNPETGELVSVIISLHDRRLTSAMLYPLFAQNHSHDIEPFAF